MFCNIDALVPMLAYFKICNIQSICVKVNLMDNKLKKILSVYNLLDNDCKHSTKFKNFITDTWKNFIEHILFPKKIFTEIISADERK
jgi:hypothetical protein